MKMELYSHANETDFYLNGCVSGLVLIERLRSTRKWVIHCISFFLTILCGTIIIFELRPF